MNKITLKDFSGGIQELTQPSDFKVNQHAQMKGFVIANSKSVETQWPIQTIGSNGTNFTGIYPLVCEAGTYLVAIDTVGRLWWVKAPAADATYATANAVTWTQITTAQNVGWAYGDGATQPAVTIQENYKMRFICAIPVKAYKYVRTPNASDLDNVVIDTDGASQTAQFSGVLLNTSDIPNSGAYDGDKNMQQVVLYIDTQAVPATPTVKALVFPNQRRIPTHEWTDQDGLSQSDFINGLFIDDEGKTEIDTMPQWPFALTSVNAPDASMHPYIWVNIDGAERAGKGIIPRANVGTTKGGLLLLGDIEWRSDFSVKQPVLDTVAIPATVGLAAAVVVWPEQVAATGRVIFNDGPGTVYLCEAAAGSAGAGTQLLVLKKRILSNVARLTLSSSPVGLVTDNVTEITVNGVGPRYNGTHTVTAHTATTISYDKTNSDRTIVNSSGKVVIAPTYTVEAKNGQTVAVPNEWEQISAIATTADTVISALQNRNLAIHLLNDTNTGPKRAGFYYSGEDIDVFDSRAVVDVGTSDVCITGMHTIGDTVIIVTTAGSDSDGLFRVQGHLSTRITYNGSVPNSSAGTPELIKGGVGTLADNTESSGLTNLHGKKSCFWQSTSTVVFIDHLGGIFYTDGTICDRLDRIGPRKPVSSTLADNIAAAGDYLFVYRAGRLLVFNVLTSDGTKGNGCWTELVVGAGVVNSMVGAKQDLFYLYGGVPMRIAMAGPDAERGSINNAAQTLTYATATIGSENEHDRTNWEKFGMTFTTPTSCTVGTVVVQSSGALSTGSFGEDGATDPVKHSATLTRTFSTPAVLGEFTVPAGIGPQANIAAIVTFTGYVRLVSAAFWATGREPRRGDN